MRASFSNVLQRAMAVVVLVSGCQAPSTPEPEAPAATTAAAAEAVGPGRINPRLLRRFKPLASGARREPPSEALVNLGRMLWFDERLSRAHDVSCDSCHPLDAYGVDGATVSTGHAKRTGRRNALTVYNAAEHAAFFWDGRAATLEEQARLPIVTPEEMAMSDERVVQTLRSIPGYVELFAQAFAGEAAPVSMPNVQKALASFEQGLVTRSRWDDYLAGQENALRPEEIEGLRLFLNVGCMGCHTGPQVGASMFRLAGELEPWPNTADQGRYEVTHLEIDRMVFKVPTLKNIAKTAPYFHDGSGATLDGAVRTMARHQLGIDLTADEVKSIVSFFDALTGELPTAYIARPALPPSSATTPAPAHD